ncbi:vacuolar protein sorting-associated protein 2.3 [Actinidia rufa]|uniref:Vacuolar protein sorting-associated protein 2.3 n=1 Tax=Actinidia rufa TaxID=165716 RepID=A0A7J0FVQ3_9ERIC|nr:vacuolar protein sorting-associated protein 2.3 [Actinidia rufa]
MRRQRAAVTASRDLKCDNDEQHRQAAASYLDRSRRRSRSHWDGVGVIGSVAGLKSRRCFLVVVGGGEGVELVAMECGAWEKKLVTEIKRTPKTGNEAMSAQSLVAVGMKGASKAMESMNKTEMMSDAIDDALDR